jgi:hypothetical protein
MQNDENTLDVQEVEQENEEVVVEETTTEEQIESQDTTEPTEKLTYEQKLARATTPEEKFAIADAEANKNRRLLGKKFKQVEKPATTPQKDTASQATNVEETVLLAQGMPEKLLSQLKKLAQLNGTSLIKAQSDPIFVAVKEKYDNELKSKKASVGSSKGSGSAKPKKDASTPGLTREEHVALFNERNK